MKKCPARYTVQLAMHPRYRMIVLNGYKNYLLIQFKEFCKKKNIITFYLPTYSSYLIQPLDVGCFNVLKRSYSRQLKTFIKIYINHIIKTEFFIVFKTVHLAIITANNIQGDFRGVGLIPYNPQAILSKFDIKLQTPIPIGPPLLDIDL